MLTERTWMRAQPHGAQLVPSIVDLRMDVREFVVDKPPRCRTPTPTNEDDGRILPNRRRSHVNVKMH